MKLFQLSAFNPHATSVRVPEPQAWVPGHKPDTFTLVAPPSHSNPVCFSYDYNPWYQSPKGRAALNAAARQEGYKDYDELAQEIRDYASGSLEIEARVSAAAEGQYNRATARQAETNRRLDVARRQIEIDLDREGGY